MPDLNLSDQIAALPLTHYADLPAASREPILLVDDSSTDRLRLKQMLERLGYQVYTAVDGINGLELLDQYRIRLIVTDLNMPNMGGYGFCKRLKTEERYGQPYVLVLTASDDKENLISCMEAGADDFVQKNARSDELRVRLAAGLRIISLRQKLEAKNSELSQVVSNLEHAHQQIDTELKFAAQLQREYVPENQWLSPSTQFASHFETARGVGGDSMGLTHPQSGKTLIYQIDVMGHGIASAMLTFTLQHTLREMFNSSSRTGNLPPLHQFARRLNERFPSERFSGHYCTLLIALIDEKSENLSFCQAGHPHPFVVAPDGQIFQSDRGSFPIGLFDFADYETRTLPFPQGSALVISTDGLFELANRENETLGINRVQERVQRSSRSSAAQIVNQLIELRDQWANEQPLNDDLSLMVIKNGDQSIEKAAMITQELKIAIDATQEQVAQSLTQLIDCLLLNHLGDQSAQRIHTVIAETLNNLVEHARFKEPSDVPQISININCSQTRVSVRLVETSQRLPALCPPRPLTLDCESGRGIHIIQAWTDQLSIRRNNNANDWHFHFDLNSTSR